MSLFTRFAFVFAFVCAVCVKPVTGQSATAIEAASGIRYERIGHWDVDRLNKVLSVEAPKFFGVTVPYTPARNAVSLYRVTYPSVIPEQNNRPTLASGLLAIPEVAGKSFPTVSYQHGTVYGKEQVPSFPDQSPETALMLAQFGGRATS